MTDSEARLINARYGLAPGPKHGGMADLFQASDLLQGNQKVALKLFKQEFTHSQLLAEAFRRESEALRQLCHPNIVKLYDSGVDKETDRHFLVLEWIDNDLSEWIKPNPFAGWDSFYIDFGQPLLQALAFAHSRQVIHRDVKPKNILVDPSGQPKLADFGIAKIKTWIKPSHTLQDWVSRPFSPPEYDDGSFTYTRDVYGFAAIVLYCLTDVELRTYDDIHHAIEELDVPDEVVAIFHKCLSDEPGDRFSNAVVLLECLDSVQQRRAEQWAEFPTYFLQFTNKALASLRLAFPGQSDANLQQLVVDDLADVVGFSLQRGAPPGPGQQSLESTPHFQAYGANVRFHLAIDQRTGSHLAILNAWRSSSSILENNRWRAFQPRCRFRFGVPPDPIKAAKAAMELRALTRTIEEHEAEIILRDAERREQELFQIWDRILKAKVDLEKAKETPLTYRSWRQEGNRLHFWINQPLWEDLVGQPRRVIVENRAIVIGEVESLEADRLTLYVKEQFDTELPATGKLVFDVAAAQTALRRQSDALDSVRFDRTVRPDLRRLLARPDRASAPEPIEIEQFFQIELDEAKKRVVRAACGSPDFLVVQGPPGTGKTTFIAETVLQYLRLHPNARVLLTSQTHVALDNAAEKIHALSDKTRILRLGLSADQKISASVRDLLLTSQMEAWRSEVLSRSDLYLKNWSDVHAISRHEFNVARLLQEYLLRLREIRSLREKVRELNQALQYESAGVVTENSSVLGSGPQSPTTLDPDEIAAIRGDIARFEAEIRHHNVDNAKLTKELKALNAAAAGILDGPESEIEEWTRILMPNSPDAQRFRQLLDLRADWESRFGKSDEFQAALIAAAHVIAGTCIGVVGIKGILDIEFDLCIVDEASKATPTELLVPLSRSRSWILVGDPMQLPPFEEEALQDSAVLSKYDLKEKDVRDALFDRLSNMLPDASRTALTIQHRMVPAIGNLVSFCFYDGTLESAAQSTDPSPVSLLPTPVVWVSTSHLSAHEETKAEESFSNQSEARVIVKLLEHVNSVLTRTGARHTVAILSGYLSQTNTLRRELASGISRWLSLDIECNTVDAFQGREADIAVYSVTRSNREGNIGFLRDIRRLNVALSRGRRFLVIVGDHIFAKTVQRNNPFRKVVEYIETHPSDCTIRQGVQ